jgi:hypothetical protein
MSGGGGKSLCPREADVHVSFESPDIDNLGRSIR